MTFTVFQDSLIPELQFRVPVFRIYLSAFSKGRKHEIHSIIVIPIQRQPLICFVLHYTLVPGRQLLHDESPGRSRSLPVVLCSTLRQKQFKHFRSSAMVRFFLANSMIWNACPLSITLLSWASMSAGNLDGQCNLKTANARLAGLWYFP